MPQRRLDPSTDQPISLLCSASACLPAHALAPRAPELTRSFKSDMCRLAMLHEHGGLYFDCDMGVRADVRTLLRPATRFATISAAVEPNTVAGFFQSFVAASPEHPMLRRTMGEHVCRSETRTLVVWQIRLRLRASDLLLLHSC